MSKPEALELAAQLDQYGYSVPAHPLCTDAAAELRRLHAENELLASAADKLRVAWRDEVHTLMKDKDQLRTQRDALLSLLKEARKIIRASSSRNLVKDWDQRTTDAIKAVEGVKA